MAIFKFGKKSKEIIPPVKIYNLKAVRPTRDSDDDIFKAYIPNFLYKPPYGMPRHVNVPQLKALGKNPFIFSVIKTLCDEATSVGWEIKVKKEFQDDPNKKSYEEKIKKVTRFFKNPNGNNHSFEHLLRQIITDICEIDAGVMVKVFNQAGEMRQLFVRDGGTFLKNPDIYGYMGNTAEFVPPLPDGFTGINMDLGGTPTVSQQQLMKVYSLAYKEKAAYFQYGWTAGSMPVPFGRREIVYFMQNPRGDSIYGRSAIEILAEIIFNLIYGVDANLDYYTNNNMPDGAISLLGAKEPHLDQFRENMESQFKFTDTLGKERKRFFKIPLSTQEIKFTQFQLSPKDMEIITQQQWFTKVLWMCFGVNADEMGYTEQSNKAVGVEQIKTFKRKAIKPILAVIKYQLDSEIMPEFFNVKGKIPDFGDTPLEFTFNTYDLDEDIKKHGLYRQQIDMGLKTPMMVAKEVGVNIEELKAEKEEALEEQKKMFEAQGGKEGEEAGEKEEKKPGEEKKEFPPAKKDKKEKEEKSIIFPNREDKPKDPQKEIDQYVDAIEDSLLVGMDRIPEGEL